MVPDLLSNIELYYSPSSEVGITVTLEGDEFKHAVNVMRHKPGEKIFVTNGRGQVFEVLISLIDKKGLKGEIVDSKEFVNEYSNFYFVIPRLKNPSRFEFALEKSVELGITNFFVFDAERSVAKGNKIVRWHKIAEAAMKQSLRSFLPNISYFNSLDEIPVQENIRAFIFEQSAEVKFPDVISSLRKGTEDKFYFVFGPEGGLTKKELLFYKNAVILQLTKNRLRSETAIVTVASLLVQV